MAVPKVSYKPMNPRGAIAGSNIKPAKMPIDTRAPAGGQFPAVNISQPPNPLKTGGGLNIGQTPQGNVPKISYNPSAPAAANNPSMNTIGQGLPRDDMFGNPPQHDRKPPILDTGGKDMPPLSEPTLPPPVAPNPQPPTTVPVPSRQEETTQQRIDRLQQNPKNPHRQERLQGLRDKLARGVEQPQGTGQGPRANPTPPTPTPATPGGSDTVQLDDQPSTWRTGDLAELAPPRGVNTYFRDEGKSEALQARKKDIKAKAGMTDTPKAKKGGGAKDVEGTTTDTSQAKKKTTGKLSDKQKKALKKRPQAGTPARPYINRGVTYNPLGAGGTLRV